MSPSVEIAVLPSPFGPIHVAATERGVVGLEMRTTDLAFEAAVAGRVAHLPATKETPQRSAADVIAEATAELADYVAGKRLTFTVPLDVRVRSDWDRRVLTGVRSIGHGEVTSYGRLAAIVGSPGAARAAGGAVGRNPIGLLVPCHRVIAGDGSIGGYGGAWFGDRDELLALKRALLAHEGVTLPARRLIG